MVMAVFKPNLYDQKPQVTADFLFIAKEAPAACCPRSLEGHVPVLSREFPVIHFLHRVICVRSALRVECPFDVWLLLSSSI